MSASTFAAIAKWAGDNDKQIIAQVLNGLDFIDDVRVVRNVSGHGMLLPKMTVSKGIRPIDLSIEKPIGNNRDFSGRKLFVYPGMKIIKMVPEEFRGTFADRGLDPKATEIPLAQWVWAREFEKISEEINNNIYLSKYFGNAADFDPGPGYVTGDVVVFGNDRLFYMANQAAAAGQSPTTHPAKWDEVTSSVISDGWGTIIKAEITAAKITPVVTGAITNANALTKFELMYKTMKPAHRNLGGIFRCASDIYRNYLEHERSTYGNSISNPDLGDGKKYLYGSGKKWEIREASWLGTSGRVIATQKENLVFGTNLESDQNKISKVIETLHGYLAIVKWLQGCEISDLETLYVNDVA